MDILFKPITDWPREDNRVIIGDKAYAVETPEELSEARKAAQRYVNLRFMAQCVDILDIDSVYIHPDTKIGAGTTVYPNTVILNDVEIGRDCRIGPFAYLRSNTRVGDNVKLGDFIEIKNSTLGDKVSVSHLAYIGDSDVGKSVNFGCGAVTVNYDGVNKHRVMIGDGAFIGCNTNLVAPVEVGKNAYTAAGSTITHNVPDGALGIARERQQNKDNWQSPKTKKEQE